MEDGHVRVVTDSPVLAKTFDSWVKAGTQSAMIRLILIDADEKARKQFQPVRQGSQKSRDDGNLSDHQALEGKPPKSEPHGGSTADSVLVFGGKGNKLDGSVSRSGPGYTLLDESVPVQGKWVKKVPNADSLDDGAFAAMETVELRETSKSDQISSENGDNIGIGLFDRACIELLAAIRCSTYGSNVRIRELTMASNNVEKWESLVTKRESDITSVSRNVGWVVMS